MALKNKLRLLSISTKHKYYHIYQLVTRQNTFFIGFQRVKIERYLDVIFQRMCLSTLWIKVFAIEFLLRFILKVVRLSCSTQTCRLNLWLKIKRYTFHNNCADDVKRGTSNVDTPARLLGLFQSSPREHRDIIEWYCK